MKRGLGPKQGWREGPRGRGWAQRSSASCHPVGFCVEKDLAQAGACSPQLACSCLYPSFKEGRGPGEKWGTCRTIWEAPGPFEYSVLAFGKVGLGNLGGGSCLSCEFWGPGKKDHSGLGRGSSASLLSSLCPVPSPRFPGEWLFIQPWYDCFPWVSTAWEPRSQRGGPETGRGHRAEMGRRTPCSHRAQPA